MAQSNLNFSGQIIVDVSHGKSGYNGTIVSQPERMEFIEITKPGTSYRKIRPKGKASSEGSARKIALSCWHFESSATQLENQAQKIENLMSNPNLMVGQLQVSFGSSSYNYQNMMISDFSVDRILKTGEPTYDWLMVFSITFTQVGEM